MRRFAIAFIVAVKIMFSSGGIAVAEDVAARPDLSKDRVLYCVGYAHLDTQWRWDFCTTIDRYIRDTLEQNFALFEKYPDYVFNFTGSVRYEMMKEYYPEQYQRLREYIAKDRWFVSGSSVDEGDVNVPSPEAIIRQVLYGNAYFRREFGRESVDFMLPDCFGFPASMPSIWAHCGLKGFSTQKLTWGSAMGIPFKIGVWEGLDGRGIIAALDPGPYVGAIEGPVHTNEEWANRVAENGRKYGVFADYHYYGVGDMGGAPRDEDVRNYVDSARAKDGPIRVVLAASDQLYKDISDEQAARLPRYKGDLLLTEHSAGTLTSQAYMKRWNRKGEILADAAERAAVVADWLGGAAYPREKLNRSWVRLLANQMHDILPGTSIPRAYTYSWNDEIVAMNGFAAVLADSAGAVARAMDTRVKGKALLVYNPLAFSREDVVEAKVEFAEPPPKSVRVFDPNGDEVPSQINWRSGSAIGVVFPARVPSLGWSVFDVRPAAEGFDDGRGPRISKRVLENEHYRLSLNDAGDVASIVHKSGGGRELLSGPAQLVFTGEKPKNWPAWNMDWADREKPPMGAVAGPSEFVVERGPVRIVIKVTRRARDSIITQRICLARGEAGRRIEFRTHVDWQSTECALKAAFPLKAANPLATYNWGMGTIERGNNEPIKYEVPSHEWIDLTDSSGEFGVSILEDSKYGSDKPADNVLRLTLLYTPGVRNAYLDQHSQDWGRHDMTYAVFGHEGDWRAGGTDREARRLNQPLIPFQVDAHDGPLGRSLSWAELNTEQVDVRAIKRAEEGDAIIVRLQELWGRDAKNVRLTFNVPIIAAYEVDGQERRIGEAKVDVGGLVLDMTPNSPRAFALKPASAPVALKPPECVPVTLPFDEDVVSLDADRADGRIDTEGRSIPGEMLPGSVTSEGVVFRLGSSAPGEKNAVACKGQTIELPSGGFDRMHFLAAAAMDAAGEMRIGGNPVPLKVQSWTGFIGQFDDRVWDRPFDEVDHYCDGRVTAITPGYIKRDTIAWFCTHRHHPKLGNEAYRFSYLYKYDFDVPKGSKNVTLPNEPEIKLLAMTLTQKGYLPARPAAALYDDFSDRGPVELRHAYPPEPPRVFDGIEPIADVVLDRQEDFESLVMGPPRTDDAIDRASGRGLKFRYFDGGGAWVPHADSGAEGDALPRLSDGEQAQNRDDTQRSVWYDGEGRFYIDMGRPVAIDRVNTYSRHWGGRATQYYSLWGAIDETMPAPGFAPGEHKGWTLIAVVDSRNLGGGGAQGASIRAKAGSIGPFRHLLFLAENMGYGTFFTEIDVYEARPGDVE